MERKPDWRSALHAELEPHRRAAFEWGVHDCGVLAADAVLAMTGVDPMAEFRGRYESLHDALRILHEAGHEDWIGPFAAVLEEERRGASRARVGDIAVVPGEGGMPSLGVVIGTRIQVMGESAGKTLPLTEAQRIFRV